VQDLDHARVELAWEQLKVSFPVEFEGKAIYWKHLEDTLAKAPDTDWTPWYQAAQYCFQMQIHRDKALAWSEKSVKIGESFWNFENRARVLNWAGRTAEAIPFLQKAADLSRGKAPKEYTENVEKDLAAWKASSKAQ
jgi:tetratricopeptide (TPR) repeat protein